MYFCLNKLPSKVWKKNYPNFSYALYKAAKIVRVIIFPVILGCFAFISNAMYFFIYSLNRFFFFFNAFVLLVFFNWVP